VPERVLDLASRSLRIAAESGASAVRPSHVKQAAEQAAAGTAAAPPKQEAAPPAPAMPEAAAVTLPDGHDEEEDDDVDVDRPPAMQEVAATDSAPEAPATSPPARKLSRAQRRAARRRSAATEAAAARTGTAPAAQATTPARPEIVADDDLDSDLPPFQPASVALPTKPSDNLPEDAKEWVSRFIPPPTTGPAGVAPEGARVAHHLSLPDDEPEPVRAPAAKRGSATPSQPTAEEAPAPRTPRRQPAIPAPPAPRRRHRSGNRQNITRAVVAAVSVLGLMAVVLRYSTRDQLAQRGGDSSRAARAGAPAREETEASTRSKAPVEQTDDRPAERRDEPAEDRPAPSRRADEDASPADKRQSEAKTSPAPAVEPPPRPTSPRFALEVASFIFEERARLERDRLAEAGLPARVTSTTEFGSRVYRVVVGGYPHPAAAERAADSLLSNGVVLQARVVTAGP
jgi:cell division septation protein DedD